MGDALADEVQRVLTEHNISADVVIPVSGECHNEGLIYNRPSHSGPRYISRCCSELSSKAGPPLSGGFHQEQIRWANIHYAWSTDEVGGGYSTVLVSEP